ncbi:MAG: hypothetical protein AB6733_10925 [Clostridiaceae bacterium]
MKQKVAITVTFTIDEEDAEVTHDYAHSVAGEMLSIAHQDDRSAFVDVRFI